MKPMLSCLAFLITLSACASIDHEARTAAYNIELDKARSLTTAKQFRDHLNYVAEQCKRLHLEDRGAVGSDLANKERKRCNSVYNNIVSIAKSKGHSVDPVAEKRAQTAAFWGNALAAMAGVGTSNSKPAPRTSSTNQPTLWDTIIAPPSLGTCRSDHGQDC